MTPVVWAAVGFVAGLIVMANWLCASRPLKSGQQQAQSLNARIAEEESARARDREEIGKLESRLQYRENDNAELKERLSKTEGQLRERQQTVATWKHRFRDWESARSDLERFMTHGGPGQGRRCPPARNGGERIDAGHRVHQQQAELDKLRSELERRDGRITELPNQADRTRKQFAEAEDSGPAAGDAAFKFRADKGRAAINRQQAEINSPRQRLDEALKQAASRNQRLTQPGSIERAQSRHCRPAPPTLRGNRGAAPDRGGGRRGSCR